MNDTPQTPFVFVPAQPKGSQEANAAAPPEKLKRTRRTKAELAAVEGLARSLQGEKPIDAFDVFDSVFEILDPLPKPVRDRIMSTLNRIYA